MSQETQETQEKQETQETQKTQQQQDEENKRKKFLIETMKEAEEELGYQLKTTRSYMMFQPTGIYMNIGTWFPIATSDQLHKLEDLLVKKGWTDEEVRQELPNFNPLGYIAIMLWKFEYWLEKEWWYLFSKVVAGIGMEAQEPV